MLHSELKQQRKLVRSLKKKSLWSRNLEEVFCFNHLLQLLEDCTLLSGIILGVK